MIKFICFSKCSKLEIYQSYKNERGIFFLIGKNRHFFVKQQFSSQWTYSNRIRIIIVFIRYCSYENSGPCLLSSFR